MSKPSKPQPLKPVAPRAETAIEKTTRAANAVIEEENAQRETETAQLRKARLEREADSKVSPKKTTSSTLKKTASGKT